MIIKEDKMSSAKKLMGSIEKLFTNIPPKISIKKPVIGAKRALILFKFMRITN